MNISDDELKESLFNQLELFKQRAEFQEVEVHHVKPHGALYNLIAVDAVKAQLVVDVIKEVFGKMMIYVPYNSKIEKVALNNKLPVFYEAFADRNYNDDLSLDWRSLTLFTSIFSSSPLAGALRSQKFQNSPGFPLRLVPSLPV